MSASIQRLLLLFTAIACCVLVRAQLPCCEVQPADTFTFGAGINPQAVAFSSVNNCLATITVNGDAGTGSVVLFTVDENCALSEPVDTVSFDTQPTAVAFSQTTNCLAVTTVDTETNAGAVSLFTVNPDCSITSVGDPVAVGLSPSSVAFSPDGSCLAVANNGSDSVSIFTVDEDCNLGEPVETVPVNISPLSLAFSSNSNCLAVTHRGIFSGDLMTLYAVENCSLTLTQLSIPVGVLPSSIAFSVNNCLAVANTGSDTLSLFSVNPNNCLIASTIPAVSVGRAPRSIAFSPSGSCLAVANGGDEETPGTVSLFIVNDNCTLTAIQGGALTFPVGSNPNSVAYSPNNCLAVASPNTNTIALFRPFVLQQPAITSAAITNCPFVTVTGTADPNVTIELFVEGDPTAVASGTTGATGSFSIEVTSLLPGTYNIFAIANTLGCTSVPSSSVPVTIGLEQPIITSAEVTSCPFITVTGTADPNVIITLFADGDLLNPIGSGSTDGVGNFMITTTEPLSFGTHSIVAVATTPSGCTSAPSEPVDVTIDIPQPVITDATVTNCNTVTVTGTTGPNATVTLFVDDNPNAIGQSDDAGNFTIVTSPLSAGPHTITAIASTAGCTSMFSEPAVATASAVPLITSVSFGCGNISTVSGASMPNTSITLLADGLSVATSTTNSEGTFMVIGASLPVGTQCITVLDNSSGCTSAPVCLTAPSIPCVIHIPNLAFGTHCNR